MVVSGNMSCVQLDYTVRSIRREILCLQNLLNSLEHEDRFDDSYINVSLRMSELRMRTIRRSLESFS